MSDELNVMRGEPVKVKLCGRDVEIKKLTITKQLDMIDLWTEKGFEADKGLKPNIKFMMGIISFVTDIPTEKLEEQSSIVEIGVAFKVIHDRELLPLLKGVGNLNSMELEVPAKKK